MRTDLACDRHSPLQSRSRLWRSVQRQPLLLPEHGRGSMLDRLSCFTPLAITVQKTFSTAPHTTPHLVLRNCAFFATSSVNIVCSSSLIDLIIQPSLLPSASAQQMVRVVMCRQGSLDARAIHPSAKAVTIPRSATYKAGPPANVRVLHRAPLFQVPRFESAPKVCETI
jgi:hypothetical protein